MRQVSIKEFQSNLYLHVKDLPIEITKRGEPIFWIVGENPETAQAREDIKIPKFCEIEQANPAVRCIRTPDGQFHVRYVGGDEPMNWTLWLCESHSKIKGEDVEVRKI